MVGQILFCLLSHLSVNILLLAGLIWWAENEQQIRRWPRPYSSLFTLSLWLCRLWSRPIRCSLISRRFRIIRARNYVYLEDSKRLSLAPFPFPGLLSFIVVALAMVKGKKMGRNLGDIEDWTSTLPWPEERRKVNPFQSILLLRDTSPGPPLCWCRTTKDEQIESQNISFGIAV